MYLPESFWDRVIAGIEARRMAPPGDPASAIRRVQTTSADPGTNLRQNFSTVKLRRLTAKSFSGLCFARGATRCAGASSIVEAVACLWAWFPADPVLFLARCADPSKAHVRVDLADPGMDRAVPWLDTGHDPVGFAVNTIIEGAVALAAMRLPESDVAALAGEAARRWGMKYGETHATD